MSTGVGAPINYRCLNDCEQSGCPGHIIRMLHHRTSDIYIFEIDGKNEHYFDENEWAAMVLASQQEIR